MFLCIEALQSLRLLSKIELYSDVIGWNESNRAYILTHGVRGVEWSNYRRLLPEHVYDVYMKCWAGVSL